MAGPAALTPPGALRAVVLFGHGSRDPAWRQPIEAVAAQAQRLAPDAVVRCAYLELCDPALDTVVAELLTAGSMQITVVPMFLGVGRHAREDLPQMVASLRAAHPGLQLELRDAIGEHPAMLALMARIVLDD